MPEVARRCPSAFCRRAVETTVRKLKRLDILVNNAAFQAEQKGENIGDSQLERRIPACGAMPACRVSWSCISPAMTPGRRSAGRGDRLPLIAGARNISTTQRYMHLDEEELAEAQDLME